MSEPIAEAYPLAWPSGRPRTQRRETARFDVSFAVARDTLMREIALLGGRQPVLSTNVTLRRDGLPYAQQAEPSDPGVAVYFTLSSKQFAFACDRWNKVRDNVQAIRHTIAALRGIERWGTGDMVQAAFTGFAALPSPESASVAPWRTVLRCENAKTFDDVKLAYRKRAAETHPDREGGSADQFNLVQNAWAMAQQEINS